MAVKPKLCLIPSAYKSEKVYSVLPSDGTGDFDFSRSGDATRINKDGLIETVSSNVPRLNYPLIDGVVSGCPSLLLEPNTTNNFSYSEDFLNSYWNKSGSSIISNSVISPDGTIGADKLVENSDTVEHFLRRSIAIPAGQYNWSVFAKASERKYIVLRTNADGGAYKNACFDIELGIVVYDGLHNNQAKIETFPNGWFRISGLSKETSGTIRNYQIHVSNSAITNNSAISYNGDGTSGFYIWGAQLEKITYSTSYIPTNGSVQTRSAETCNGAGSVNTFNDSEGVLMAEISALDESGGNREFTLSDGSTSNRVIIQYRDSSKIRIILTKTTGDEFDTGVIPFNTIEINKIAIKYKTNDFAFWVNGIKVYSNNTGNTFSANTLSQINFDSGTGGNDFYGNIKQIQYFDTSLTDEQLAELTTL